MVHQDNETRIGAHRIFSVVLVPSSVCPQPTPNKNIDPKNVLRSLSRNVSVFSSSAALFQKMKRDKTTVGKEKVHNEVEQPKINNVGMMNRIKSTYSRTYSIKIPVSQVGTTDNVCSFTHSCHNYLSTFYPSFIINSSYKITGYCYT